MLHAGYFCCNLLEKIDLLAFSLRARSSHSNVLIAAFDKKSKVSFSLVGSSRGAFRHSGQVFGA